MHVARWRLESEGGQIFVGLRSDGAGWFSSSGSGGTGFGIDGPIDRRLAQERLPARTGVLIDHGQ